MVETATATITMTSNVVLSIESFLTTSSRSPKLPTLLHSHPVWLELENTISQNLEFHDSELRSQRTHRGLLTPETVWCLNIILTGDWSLARSDLSPNERCITWELTIFLPRSRCFSLEGSKSLFLMLRNTTWAASVPMLSIRTMAGISMLSS